MPSPERELSAVERRMDAVRAVRRVVHAIWAVSSAQLPLVERAVAAASDYLAWVDQVVARLIGPPVPGAAPEALWVVLGPERAYSGSLARDLLAELPAEGAVGLVGRRLAEVAAEISGVSARVRFELPGATSHEQHDEVAQAVARAVLEHARSADVHLLGFGASGPRTALILGRRYSPAGLAPETYSPLPVVLDHAVTEALSSRLSVAVAEALRAELLHRIAAAERAKSACDSRLEELTHDWRAARQEHITSELVEIVSGRLVAPRALPRRSREVCDD
ncbi:MAG: F0F1 ATP synthase subunit gamma [Polyangiaceae bacterium]|nr:F0F1 ATP synthase subunit gamma [Polyangiaceae bacterium]